MVENQLKLIFRPLTWIISWMSDARDGDLSKSNRRAIFECFSERAFSMSNILPKPCLTSVSGMAKVETNMRDARRESSAFIWGQFLPNIASSRANPNGTYIVDL